MFTSRLVLVGVCGVLLTLAAFTALAVVNANSISSTRLSLSEQRVLDEEKAGSTTRLGLSELRLLNAKPVESKTDLNLSERRLLNAKPVESMTGLNLSERRLLNAEGGLDRHDRNVLRWIHWNWGQ